MKALNFLFKDVVNAIENETGDMPSPARVSYFPRKAHALENRLYYGIVY